MSGKAISEQPLRIGIDGEALRVPLTGVGQYVWHLCVELEKLLPHAEFFAYVRKGGSAVRMPSERWHVRAETSPFWQRLPSVAWLKLRSHRLIREDRLDVYWGGRTFLPKLDKKVRTVVTVHDLNAYIAPETMGFKHKWAHHAWFAADARRADSVTTNSHGTAKRLKDLLGIETHAVVPPGVSDAFLAVAWQAQRPVLPKELVARGVRAPYLLSVATHEPRKNLVRLLDAFLQLRSTGQLPGFQLVLVGSSGWKNQELAARLVDAPDVLRTGYVVDEWLPALYANAEAMVFPSTYEGFGMPVLEATLCGARVVATDIPELREAGGRLTTYVEPTVNGIVQGIRSAFLGPDLTNSHRRSENPRWSQSASIIYGQIVIE